MATYGPSTYQASQLQDVATYDAAQQGPANYINQYLQPLVDQSQQQAIANVNTGFGQGGTLGCLLYTSPSPRDRTRSRMPSSA